MLSLSVDGRQLTVRISLDGRCRNGGLGDNSTANHFFPVEVSGGGQWQSVFVPGTFTCGIQTGGALFCWVSVW